MTLPALIRLRERFPKASISILTHEKLEQLWRGQAVIDEVITFAKSDSVLKVAGILRGQQFDLALVLPNSPRSALRSCAATEKRWIWATWDERREACGAAEH